MQYIQKISVKFVGYFRLIYNRKKEILKMCFKPICKQILKNSTENSNYEKYLDNGNFLCYNSMELNSETYRSGHNENDSKSFEQ